MKSLLIFGVLGNTLLLAYFKYMNFFISNIHFFFGFNLSYINIALPLGISFFTFQQIAYLVDAYRGEAKVYAFKDYALFITFFPHLIAGPLVHHKDIIKQFEDPSVFNFKARNISEGFTLFCIGLFKKVILADGIGQYANLIFNYIEQGHDVSFLPAWCGILAYTFQIYFDFSGYSDMAIGLARILGVRLPCNFNSPYKSTSIIDFWRRWNITLSGFLKSYLYIGLGGNRKGKLRRYINLMITMTLGGLWHGASWTFVFWGILHGFYLCINHAWRSIKKLYGASDLHSITWFNATLSRAVTFLTVSIAWVFFRAKSFSNSITMLRGMFLYNGLTLPKHYQDLLQNFISVKFINYNDKINYLVKPNEILMILICFLIILLPNSQQFINKHFFSEKSDGFIFIKSTGSAIIKYTWIALFSLIFVFCLILSSKPNAFIYFKF
ncbi:MBOAT family O-acyltransferase [Candidiatus Paracoxiella cheracis]|uniref:MBOAT family O-acyltransferase n=1 Tax=Candidiatus Paracoxiella cheracis TaxID=3405120 RepID=UPI003BF5F0F0